MGRHSSRCCNLINTALFSSEITAIVPPKLSPAVEEGLYNPAHGLWVTAAPASCKATLASMVAPSNRALVIISDAAQIKDVYVGVFIVLCVSSYRGDWAK